MKQRTRGIARHSLTAVITLGVIAAVLFSVPRDGWLQWGQYAAMLSAGLRQPVNTVLALTPQPEPPLLEEAPSDLQEEDWVFSPIHATLPSLPPSTAPTPADGGTVLTKQFSAGEVFVQGVAIQNNSGVSVNIAAALQTEKITAKEHPSPQVLITHTHTTECYLTHDDGVYTAQDETRSHDNRKTVVAVGEAVATALRQAGIGVIHDTVIHDEPYTGAYGSSKAQVQQLLQEYPTIQVVLDIHRDAIYPDGNTRIKPTAIIDGKKAAQVMILVGMKNTKTVPNPYVTNNLALGARLQQEIHRTYEGLARPMLLADARYNQQLNAGSLLIEVGSDANTAEEAIYAGELLGKSLVQVLQS